MYLVVAIARPVSVDGRGKKSFNSIGYRAPMSIFAPGLLVPAFDRPPGLTARRQTKGATGRQPVAPEFFPATGLLLPVASRARLGRGRSGQARQQQAQNQPERQNPRRLRHRVRSIASAPGRRQGVFARPRGADEYRGSSSPSTRPSTA